MNMKPHALAAAMLLSTLGTAAYAAPLVANGDFSSSTYAANSQFGTNYGGQGVTGWTGNGGYNLYFTSAATSTTTTAYSQYSPDGPKGNGLEKLWGNGASVSVPAGTVPNSPNGGAFVALDGDYKVAGGISQTISGLTVNDYYRLDFDWGAAQVQSRSGDTTESFVVTLGGQTFTTPVVADTSKSFSGWKHQAFTFTASSATEMLTFLSKGTPTGLPPIATLDGVSLVDVPEPASLALFGFGLLGIYAVRRRFA